ERENLAPGAGFFEILEQSKWDLAGAVRADFERFDVAEVAKPRRDFRADASAEKTREEIAPELARIAGLTAGRRPSIAGAPRGLFEARQGVAFEMDRLERRDVGGGSPHRP